VGVGPGSCGMDGTAGLQSLGSERETWIDEEVEALLDVWGNTYIHVKRENLGKRHWETVVKEVNIRLSHQREQPQMKNKIDSLKKRYKREKLSKGESDRNLITWKWYDRCDMLWGTPKRERASNAAVGGRTEAHVEIMNHHELGRIVPFLNVLHPEVNGVSAGNGVNGVNADQGVKVGRIDDCMEGSPRAEAPPSPCMKCRHSNAGPEGARENSKRRKYSNAVSAKNVAALFQGFADTYARVEQAKMEMTLAMEERRLQFLERMEERRLEMEEKNLERKAKMEERRLEMQEKLMEQKLEMQEKHLERRETLKVELLRLRLQVTGQTSKLPAVEQQAVQTCEKFSSSNITTCM
jgi:hypothetical protein